ncbi:MAG: bifunctional DNA-formamidopyrimidine glycosylase/DNA-(apurinic or apyrimidinic site) lyase [Deltaproteobacteria bacterium]|nr:bifunctional DNA-formamidopyrimidine glycosylase/DNA-(apurinic or apyrimidinic site) lyase [Deltaproteobacteria bacterium]
MPELPEVEIAARNLRKWARGWTIARAHVPRTRVIRGSSPAAVVRALEGRVIARVDRRGKWLRWTLDDDSRVFSHLGMSGRWVRRTMTDATERSQRLRLDLARGGLARGARTTSLRYVDPRMFGRFVVSRDDISEWSSLGPDPLVDGVDEGVLAGAIGRRKRAIKDVLMDQTAIAGVGNILATESLWRARIDPRTPATSLGATQLRAIARAIAWSIERTLALEEGPELQYVEEPGAPNPFVIYGRGGEPCPRCRTPLTRAVLGGRATVFCHGCQH